MSMECPQRESERVCVRVCVCVCVCVLKEQKKIVTPTIYNSYYMMFFKKCKNAVSCER